MASMLDDVTYAGTHLGYGIADMLDDVRKKYFGSSNMEAMAKTKIFSVLNTALAIDRHLAHDVRAA